MNITFIGYGHMAKAIAEGLAQNKSYCLRACSPSLPIALQDKLATHPDNCTFITDADIILVAVKPKQMAEVLTQISPQISRHTVLVSIAAGLNLSWLAGFLPPDTAIIRAMPNLGASVALSATPLIANAFANLTQRQWVEQVFCEIGIITWIVQEKDMNALTALSGSGPAYLFAFMEAMISSATQLGLSLETAELFTKQTVKGAITIACQSAESLTQLRKKVTSTGGTTEAALHVLGEYNLNHILLTAMQAAYDRTQHLMENA